MKTLFLDTINFFETGNLFWICCIYIISLLAVFILTRLIINRKFNLHWLAVLRSLLLIFCTLIGRFTFDDRYLSRIFVGAFMLLFAIYLMMKFDGFRITERRKKN